MANYKRKTDFILVHDLLVNAIRGYSAAKIKDAQALTDREGGMHNLQGHTRAVIPLAVWIAYKEPSLLPKIKKGTTLKGEMTGHSVEARDNQIWGPLKKAMKRHLKLTGIDVIAEKTKANSPDSAAKIASTYLSDDYGGGQTSGGAGNTVLKRALKLLAHTLPI